MLHASNVTLTVTKILILTEISYTTASTCRDFSGISRTAFSTLTPLVGRQEGHPACKNWVVRYWRGYLSGARCKWFAYGPADATATPSSLALVKSIIVYPSGAGLPRLSWKKGRKTDVVVVQGLGSFSKTLKALKLPLLNSKTFTDK